MRLSTAAIFFCIHVGICLRYRIRLKHNRWYIENLIALDGVQRPKKIRAIDDDARALGIFTLVTACLGGVMVYIILTNYMNIEV